MSDTTDGLTAENLPEGAKAAQELAADAAPGESTIGQGSPDADKLGGLDAEGPTGGVVDSGMPDNG